MRPSIERYAGLAHRSGRSGPTIEGEFVVKVETIIAAVFPAGSDKDVVGARLLDLIVASPARRKCVGRQICSRSCPKIYVLFRTSYRRRALQIIAGKVFAAQTRLTIEPLG